MNNKKYQLTVEHNKLIFTTSSFKAEKTSVLHSGVYTKEFASMLFASATSLLAYMLSGSLSSNLNIIRYLVITFVFIISFLGSRKFVFKERFLKVIFNKSDNTVSVIRPGIIRKNIEKIPLQNIVSIELGSKKFIPQNIDGINFVQKISLQHGSAVPGLSEEEEFITLLLKLTDGTERVIYAGKIEEEPEVPLKTIKDFLANSNNTYCHSGAT
jgi:hypothetical protein